MIITFFFQGRCSSTSFMMYYVIGIIFLVVSIHNGCTAQDACSSNPCQNGGICFLASDSSSTNAFICTCPQDYAGPLCEISTGQTPPSPVPANTPCASNPCMNGATCVNPSNPESTTALCQCAPGYVGYTCDRQDTGRGDCDPNPCGEYGTCDPSPFVPRGYTCLCIRGFTGANCDISLSGEYNGCGSSPCLNGALCINQYETNDYYCECTSGYSGRHCEVEEYNGCGSSPCLNGAVCINQYETNDYYCECASGYSGRHCEAEEYNGCGSSPCLNGAVCINQYETNDYYCECASGYSGRHCEVEGPCVGRPCLNGGTCQEEAFASLGYMCVCSSQYYGDNCTEAYQSNPCNPTPCQNEGVCFQLMESQLIQNVAPYFCLCENGFIGSTCQNRDPCYSGPCVNGGTCTLIAPGGNEDMVQGFWCDCSSNFTGTTCSEPDPCLSNPCLNGATCTTVRDVIDPLFEDASAVYICTCDIGWSGINCGDQELPPYDACSSNPCLNGAQCTAISTFYTCQCIDGFVGSNCGLIDPCSSNPCVNDGQCFISSQLNSFICQCTMPFMGQHCEIYEPSCMSQPCLNGGTCTFDINLYQCQCPTGFLGLQCESADPCFPQPCQNDAVCWRNADATSFLCRCDPGYTGIYCEEPLPPEPVPTPQIHLCETSPCQGDSTCELEGPDASGNFYPMCLCPLGFTGSTCSIQLPPTALCQPSPCVNGGLCTPSPHSNLGFICSCLSGYAGSHCEYVRDGEPPVEPTAIDFQFPTSDTPQGPQPCDSNPCQNNSTCVDNNNLFVCLCPTYFVGPTCATDIRDCSFGGQIFRDGESRNEGCGECVCDNSEWVCLTSVCECYADGNVYSNNETWYEDCNKCACQDGIILCTTIDCSTVCLHGGELFDVGTQRDEKCSTCICQFRRWYCAPIDDCVDNTCMYGSTPYDEGSIRPQHCNLCTCRQNNWQCTTSSCDENPAGFQITIELDKDIPAGKENEFMEVFRTGMIQAFTLGNKQIQDVEILPSNGSRVYLQFSIVKNSSEEISVDVIREAVQTKVESGSFEIVFDGHTYRAISSTFNADEIETPTETPSTPGGGNNMSVIIGAVGGSIGIVVVVLCIVIFLYLYSKRKGGKEGNSNVPLHLQQFDVATPPESPISRTERSRTVPAHYRFKNPFI